MESQISFLQLYERESSGRGSIFQSLMNDLLYLKEQVLLQNNQIDVVYHDYYKIFNLVEWVN